MVTCTTSGCSASSIVWRSVYQRGTPNQSAAAAAVAGERSQTARISTPSSSFKQARCCLAICPAPMSADFMLRPFARKETGPGALLTVPDPGHTTPSPERPSPRRALSRGPASGTRARRTKRRCAARERPAVTPMTPRRLSILHRVADAGQSPALRCPGTDPWSARAARRPARRHRGGTGQSRVRPRGVPPGDGGLLPRGGAHPQSPGSRRLAEAPAPAPLACLDAQLRAPPVRGSRAPGRGGPPPARNAVRRGRPRVPVSGPSSDARLAARNAGAEAGHRRARDRARHGPAVRPRWAGARPVALRRARLAQAPARGAAGLPRGGRNLRLQHRRPGAGAGTPAGRAHGGGPQRGRRGVLPPPRHQSLARRPDGRLLRPPVHPAQHRRGDLDGRGDLAAGLQGTSRCPADRSSGRLRRLRSRRSAAPG